MESESVLQETRPKSDVTLELETRPVPFPKDTVCVSMEKCAPTLKMPTTSFFCDKVSKTTCCDDTEGSTSKRPFKVERVPYPACHTDAQLAQPVDGNPEKPQKYAKTDVALEVRFLKEK